MVVILTFKCIQNNAEHCSFAYNIAKLQSVAVVLAITTLLLSSQISIFIINYLTINLKPEVKLVPYIMCTNILQSEH